MTGPDAAAREAEVLFALIRERYGSRLGEAELEALREGVRAIVETAAALRAVRLANADEPSPPFRPFRADA